MLDPLKFNISEIQLPDNNIDFEVILTFNNVNYRYNIFRNITGNLNGDTEEHDVGGGLS